MATDEQWKSRHVEGFRGIDDNVLVETRIYDIDEADVLTWIPPAGYVINFQDRDMYLSSVLLERHEKGTKAVAEVVYSTAAIPEERELGDTEEYLIPAGSNTRLLRTDSAQHEAFFDLPSGEMIYGRIRWESELPLYAMEYIGYLNQNPRGMFDPFTLRYEPPYSRRVGFERWRVEHMWMWHPDGWSRPCEIVGCDAEFLLAKGIKDMGALFAGGEVGGE